MSLVPVQSTHFSGMAPIMLPRDPVQGDHPRDRFGYDIDVSESGNTMAIGALWNNGRGQKAGLVRVMEFQNDA